MKNLHIYFAYLVFTLFVFKANSQTKTNLWLRSTFEIPIVEKVEFDLELQHRRQSDFDSNNSLDKTLLSAIRTWIYYKENDTFSFGFSPIAYFSNNKIILKPEDAFSSATNEYRISGQIELKKEIVNSFSAANRSMIEYRIFEGSIANTIRIRNRLGFKYTINKIWSTTISDEILVNIYGAGSNYFYDQNRLNGNVTIKAAKNLKLDVGYIFITRKTKASENLLNDNNIFFNASYLLNFQKRKSNS